MGISSERAFEHESKDPENWRTWKCKHCGENFRVNRKTKENIFDDGFCPECHYKLMSTE